MMMQVAASPPLPPPSLVEEEWGKSSLLHARKGEAETDGIKKEGIRPPRLAPLLHVRPSEHRN